MGRRAGSTSGCVGPWRWESTGLSRHRSSCPSPAKPWLSRRRAENGLSSSVELFRAQLRRQWPHPSLTMRCTRFSAIRLISWSDQFSLEWCLRTSAQACQQICSLFRDPTRCAYSFVCRRQHFPNRTTRWTFQCLSNKE